MVTQAKRDERAELAKIKAQAKAAKAEAKAAAAKKRAKLQKRSENQELRAANLRGSKGVLVSAEDIKDPNLRAEVVAASAAHVPPHRYDVHLKKEQITVVVTLHHVPPKTIDVSETTDARLVVATPKFTKHFRLEFDFPDGMRVDASKGDYTFDGGELTCIFPVTKMPPEIVRAWTQRLESVRGSQRARFDIDKDGDLVVRKRKTTLQLQEAKAKREAAKASKAEKKAEKEIAAPAAGKKTAPATKAEPKKKNGNEEAPAAAPKGGASAKVGPGAKDDKKAMLRIAAEAAAKVSTTLKSRLEVARAAHERRLQRSQISAVKKGAKAERTQTAFSRVLEDKRRELAAKEARVAPKAPAKQKDGPRKSVSFA